MKRFLPFLVIGAVLVGAVLVTVALVRSSRPANTNSNTVLEGPPGAQPPHVRGNAEAAVTLEEFADFQCPTCARFYPEVKKIEEEFGSRLRVVFRPYPLFPSHPYSVMAAKAAEAAGLQGRFWEMHDKLFENQATWSDAKDPLPIFADYAKQIGLDMERYERDRNGDEVDQRIHLDGIRGHGLGVKSTPSFYVNGRGVGDDSFSPDGLREMINQALSGAPAP